MQLSLTFVYLNWKGNVSIRRVRDAEFWFGRTFYHPDEQWFLKAFDLDKQEERNFAAKDIIRFL